ncbi:adenosine receptor A2b [Lingula anatina]|uniref:Adenosine receptor A2b n=1 Tax=Lingula anatina TaxID=7574 RepID=A0A1S3IDQ5_LINAN|nr:adenosine receptor A2b [Lingula anatina]|eukprot:XP_013395986.1 adenosine receptor A2b [Lingula anatina]
MHANAKMAGPNSRFNHTLSYSSNVEAIHPSNLIRNFTDSIISRNNGGAAADRSTGLDLNGSLWPVMNSSPSPNVTSDDYESQEIFISIGLAIATLGLIGNIVSLMALSKMRRPLEPLHLHLINLAVSDLVVVALTLVSSAIYLMNLKEVFPKFSEAMCIARIFSEVSFICLLAPLLATSGLVINQYLAVTRLLKYKSTVTRKRVYHYITFTWGLTIAVGILLHVTAVALQQNNPQDDETPSNLTVTLCKVYDSSDDVYYQLSAYTYSVLFLAITLIVSSFYCKTCTAVQREMADVEVNRRHSSVERKVNVTIALLFGTIILFWLPGIADGLVTIVYFSKNQQCTACMIFHQTTNLWFFANSVFDPLIYGVRLPQVREGYHALYVDTINRFLPKKKRLAFSFRYSQYTPHNTSLAASQSHSHYYQAR